MDYDYYQTCDYVYSYDYDYDYSYEYNYVYDYGYDSRWHASTRHTTYECE